MAQLCLRVPFHITPMSPGESSDPPTPFTHPGVGMSPGHHPCCPLLSPQPLWAWPALYPTPCCHWLRQQGTVTVWDVTLLFWGSDSYPSPRLWELLGGKPRHSLDFAVLHPSTPRCQHFGLSLPTGVALVASEKAGKWLQHGPCCSQTPHPGWWCFWSLARC